MKELTPDPASKKVEPQPVQAPPVQAPVAPAPPQKNNPWPWIVGGCLIIFIIILLVIFLLGWLGIREAKKQINKYEPTIEDVKENIDKLNEEGEEWQKKSAEFRDALPDADALPQNIQPDYPAND